jgi:hypothetical protein
MRNAAAVPLQHPAPKAELSLATDASDTHIRGVMQQQSGDHWRPLGCFFLKLTDTESRYRAKPLHRNALKLAFCQTGAQRLAGDISTGVFRPIVPLNFRKYIFAHFHNVAHPGRLASRRIISSCHHDRPR